MEGSIFASVLGVDSFRGPTGRRGIDSVTLEEVGGLVTEEGKKSRKRASAGDKRHLENWTVEA